jgi:co-chaperonin GroES (HSP10)
VQALRDEVILKPEPLEDEVTASGLLLPQSISDIPRRADGNPIPSTVVSVGPEADPDLEPGMRVICMSRNKRARVFERDGQPYACVPSSEVDAVID